MIRKDFRGSALSAALVIMSTVDSALIIVPLLLLPFVCLHVLLHNQIRTTVSFYDLSCTLAIDEEINFF